MITDQQRAERKNYIGSSDAAGVLGLSRWNSPLSVWAEKTGQYARPEPTGMAVKLGVAFEGVIAKLFTDETGLELETVPDTLYHPQYRCLAANLDFRVKDQRVLVEAKYVGPFSRGDWQDGKAPTEYAIQTMHQLAVSGYDSAYLVALISTPELKIVPIARDERALAELVSREVEFWESFVMQGVMPATFKPQDTGVLEALYPEAAEGRAVPLTDADAAVIESIQAMEADLKLLEDQIDTSKNQLRAALGSAEVGRIGPHTVKWSNVQTTRLDTTAIKTTAPDIYKKFSKTTASRRFTIQSKPITGEIK